MRFYIGQKVLCVNERFGSYCSHPVKKGLVYTIHGFYKCGCGSDQVTLFERPYINSMKCGCGRLATRRQSYYNWRFIPLQYFEKFIGWAEKETTNNKVTAEPEETRTSKAGE